MIYENWCPQSKVGPVSSSASLSEEQKQHSARKLQFSCDQIIHKCLSIIMINNLCCGKLETSNYASGPTWGPSMTNQAKNGENLDFSSYSAWVLAFSSQRLSSIWCEANKSNWLPCRETHWLARSQNVSGPAAARAQSCAACGCSECVRQSESTYAQLIDLMSRIAAHNRLCDDSLESATCALGTNWA